jgi:hypothetical protein
LGLKDNIKLNLEEPILEVVEWIYLAQDRHEWRDAVNTVMNYHVP